MINTTVAIMTTRWLTEEALSNPIIGGRFVEYAAQRVPEAWASFAECYGKDLADPDLALNAAVELLNLIREAVTAHLDKLCAQAEVGRVLGGMDVVE